MSCALRDAAAVICRIGKIGQVVGCKQRTATDRNYGPEVGDAYCYTAIERTTKLLLTYDVGKRDQARDRAARNVA